MNQVITKTFCISLLLARKFTKKSIYMQKIRFYGFCCCQLLLKLTFLS